MMLQVQRNGLLSNRLKKLSTRDFLAISDEIANNTSLQELEVLYVARKNLPALGGCISPSLKKISIIYGGEYKDFPDISIFLHTLFTKNLTSITLEGIVSPAHHFELLGNYLSSTSSTLQELYLRYLLFQNQEGTPSLLSLDKLATGLYSNTTLTTLSIEPSNLCFISLADLNALTQLFKVNKTITSFHLNASRLISDEISEQLASAYNEFTDAIAKESSVIHLTLSYMHNLHFFSDVLLSYNLSSLRLVGYTGSGWPEEVRRANIEHIIDLILHSESFYKLQLDGYSLETDDVKDIANVLSKNPVLSEMALNVNASDYSILAEGLTHNTNLTSLTLKNYFNRSHPANSYKVLAENIVARNRMLNTTLFDRLYYITDEVDDDDFDENGYYKSKKRCTTHTYPSGKRIHTSSNKE
jgi:hypothetical protein